VQLYLRSVLAHLPAATPDEIERYLPDRWKSDLMAEQQAATDAKQDQWPPRRRRRHRFRLI
jgi:hypothetical protein